MSELDENLKLLRRKVDARIKNLLILKMVRDASDQGDESGLGVDSLNESMIEASERTAFPLNKMPEPLVVETGSTIPKPERKTVAEESSVGWGQAKDVNPKLAQCPKTLFESEAADSSVEALDVQHAEETFERETKPRRVFARILARFGFC